MGDDQIQIRKPSRKIDYLLSWLCRLGGKCKMSAGLDVLYDFVGDMKE
jgi:hypothetical protein